MGRYKIDSILQKNYPSVFDLQYLQQNIFIIPMSFGKEHKAKLAHTEELMEYRQGYVAIHPRHNKANHCFKNCC